MLTREMLPAARVLVNWQGQAEGWELGATLDITPTEESPFVDDDEAAAFVRSEAAKGSIIHKLAIECAMLPHQPYFGLQVQ